MQCSWTKLITKSGTKFNLVLERLREIQLPEVAAPYRELRKIVVNAKLSWFLNQRNSLNSDCPAIFESTFDGFPNQTGCDTLMSQDWL
jgi:hypothetical protein